MTKKPKLTPKQEAFCLAYIEIGNASEAYRRVYDAGNMKPETVNRKAKELMDNGKITARITELQKHHQGRHDITVDDLTDQLKSALKKAMGEPKGASAAVSAIMGMARLHGLLTDKILIGRIRVRNEINLDGNGNDN